MMNPQYSHTVVLYLSCPVRCLAKTLRQARKAQYILDDFESSTNSRLTFCKPHSAAAALVIQGEVKRNGLVERKTRLSKSSSSTQPNPPVPSRRRYGLNYDDLEECALNSSEDDNKGGQPTPSFSLYKDVDRESEGENESVVEELVDRALEPLKEKIKELRNAVLDCKIRRRQGEILKRSIDNQALFAAAAENVTEQLSSQRAETRVECPQPGYPLLKRDSFLNDDPEDLNEGGVDVLGNQAQARAKSVLSELASTCRLSSYRKRLDSSTSPPSEAVPQTSERNGDLNRCSTSKLLFRHVQQTLQASRQLQSTIEGNERCLTSTDGVTAGR